MLTIEDVRKRLRPMNLKAVAEDSGISYYKVRQIANGSRKLDYESVKKMSDYLTKQRAG